ncbi:MAG: hypothetical protein V1833_00500 [Elusimicrobiota bacterium]
MSSVKVFYRQTTPPGAWNELTMSYEGADIYITTIPAIAVTTSGIEYYIEAQDNNTYT